MKWQTLSLGLWASLAIGSPLTAVPKKDIYTLRVSSKFATEIDGLTLRVRPNGKIGVFPGSPAVQFYTVFPSSEREGPVELHTYPGPSSSSSSASSGEEVIALVGTGDLLDLAVVSDPSPQTCDWKSFWLVQSRPGKPDNLVTYRSDRAGGWVAFKGADGWTINWRGAGAITIEKRSYMVVDLIYAPAGSDEARADPTE